jgi:hypothetical protein
MERHVSLIIVEAAMPDGYRMVMMSPTNVKDVRMVPGLSDVR